jgi:hypothetical protein
MTYNISGRLLFFLPFLAALSCGSTKHSNKSATLPGTWQAQPIAIDGDSKDWPSPYPNYDAKAMVAYATSNDAENLYITMETGDELTQMKILKQGMVVSIDTNGKKDAQFNINYPLPNDNESLDMPKQGSHLDNNSYAGKKFGQGISRLAKEANQYSLEGFRNCNGGYVVTQTTTCGIKVILKIDEFKELVWEAVIPFKAIYGKDAITAADAGRPISVCFAVNRFKHPETKAENNSGMNNTMNSASMQGAGGRGAPGASRGGGHNMSNDPMQQLYENTRTWKQFGLAYQPH